MSKINRLRNLSIYTAGPIDEAVDFTSWRNDISVFLWGLGAGVLNPCDKPLEDHNEDDEFRDHLKYLKETREYDKLSRLMSDIVTIDLHMVDLSSAVILYIDKDIHMCGSYFEGCYACLERKPLIVMCKQGKKAVPNWLYGIAKHQLFFETWQQVKDYLNHVNSDEIVDSLNGRWKFINSDKIFNRVSE